LVETIGRRLASTYEFDRVYTARTLAARETVELVRLTGVGPQPYIEPAWQPRDAGVFQGIPHEQLEHTAGTEAPHTDVDVLRSRPCGGENLADGRKRVLDRWQKLCEAMEEETVLVVTHDFPIAVILASITANGHTNELIKYAPGECSTTTVRLASQEPMITDPGVVRGQQG